MPPGIVDYGKIANIVIKGVDSEIPAPNILLQRAENIIAQQAPILMNYLLIGFFGFRTYEKLRLR